MIKKPNDISIANYSETFIEYDQKLVYYPTIFIVYNQYQFISLSKRWDKLPPIPESGFIPNKDQGNKSRVILGQKGYGNPKKGYQNKDGKWWYPADHHTGPHYEEHDLNGNATGKEIYPDGEVKDRKGQTVNHYGNVLIPMITGSAMYLVYSSYYGGSNYAFCGGRINTGEILFIN